MVQSEFFAGGMAKIECDYSEQECSRPCGRLHSVKSLLRRNASWDKWLRPYSEDAPESAVKHEGLLSPVQIVTGNPSSTTGAVNRNHFIVRRGSYSVCGTLKL